ncbi:hypothetical protein MTR67_035134 [Solanum verrucosum]|uniref:Gag-pol polyprotein n=1 Tax=Solanum verrucosum TaxID=315347 RepID=A0AAF0ZM08_SOLVR|nr:hypothetical protein MTR67_035134 [Solanum verrucosum]
MTTQRAFSRGNEGDNVNQGAPLQASIDPLTEQVTNAEFRDAFQVLAQAVTSQANREVVFLVNPNLDTTAYGVRNLTRRNPSEGRSRKLERVRTKDSNSRYDGYGCPRFRQSPSGSGVNAPKQNRFYALQTHGEQQVSPDVDIDVSKVFQHDVYALLDPKATLSFVMPFVDIRFDVLSDVLLEPFSVSTPVGDSNMARRVYRRYPISLAHKVTLVDLVELDMLDIDVILVKKMISKGCIYHLVRVMDVDSKIPTLDSVPIVNEFLETFLDYLPGIPPERKINFGIDLLPDTQPIYVPLYRMALAELKECKEKLKDWIRVSSY